MLQASRKRNGGRLLSRIRRDTTGNTLALVAAALIPLTAMIGGGVDVARIYMAKARLQQACDAGSLAGRRVMGSGTWTTSGSNSAESQAEGYFHANFADGTYGSSDVEIAFSEDEGTVTGQASAVLPLVVMQMFSSEDRKITVSCDAALDLSNTDIMFSLDTTGSMAWCVDGGRSCNSGAGSRIVALREAVLAFHDALSPTVSEDSQLRYGFVPYSSSVNVGKILYDTNPAWLKTTATYQSRSVTTSGVQAPSAWGEPSIDRDESGHRNKSRTNWTDVSTNTSVTKKKDCENLSATADAPVAVGEPDIDNYDEDIDNTTGTKTVTYTETQSYSQIEYQYKWSSSKCKLQKRTYTYDIETDVEEVSEATEWTEVPGQGTAKWLYGPTTYDLNSYVATINGGDAVTTLTGNSGTAVSSTWNGCVEERQTVSDSTFSPISADAFDLNIDMVPTEDPTTKWTPAWSNIVYKRQNINTKLLDYDDQNDWTYQRASHSCPSAAKKLGSYDRDAVEEYVDDLQAVGSTYHDMGLIWGARLMSPTGLFASENAFTPSGDIISRHLIFMTDGELAPNTDLYGLYGVEYLDRRITGAAGTGVQFNRHEDRFVALCQAVRNMNITIWVVGLGTDLSDAMYECAGETRESASHVFESDTADDLVANFRRIAGDIAALRLES